MGRRELLLIALFVAVGVVVYRATSPPTAPGEEGPLEDAVREIRGFFNEARREIGGNRVAAEDAKTFTFEAAGALDELRVHGYVTDVQVRGEVRDDIQVELRVLSRAPEESEAKGHLERTVLQADRVGSSLDLRVSYPREGRQFAHLTIAVPSRLRVRVDARPERLTVKGVAAVETTNSAGQTTIGEITGAVIVAHRGGQLAIEGAEEARISARNTDVSVGNVRGGLAMIIEQGRATAGPGLEGAIDVQSRQADVTLDHLGATRGPVRVDAVGGTVRLQRLQAEARLDGRGTKFHIEMERAAPITVYSDGEGVTLTPPPASYTLDVVVEGGRISPGRVSPALGLQTEGTATGQRVAGAVGGGGAPITVRATGGDVTLHASGR